MDPITQEIEKEAERLEKSQASQAFSIDLIKSTVKALGAEGLRKAAPNLDEAQKELLRSVLEEMRLEKSHTEPVTKPSKTLEPAINTAEGGDYEKNESKPRMTEEDDKLAEQAEKKKQQDHSHQGDRPEGLPGQVIKSEPASDEDLTKGGYGSGRKPINPALAGIESVKQLAERAKEAESTQTKFKEQESKAPKAKKEDKEGSAVDIKKSLKDVISRMQAKGLAKADCVARLAKSFSLDAEKLDRVWERIEKSMVEDSDSNLTGIKPNPEESQSDAPAHMKDDKPASKREPESGEPETTADGGEQPPALKKSNSFYFEDEEVYLAKSENPFFCRTTGQNVTYTVDEAIARDAIATAERLSKSTFDWDDEEDETLAKSEEDPAQTVVDANAKQEAQAKKEQDAQAREIKLDEQLSRIEGQGRKMPAMVKSFANELIAKGLDMDSATLESAEANRVAEAQGAFLVKSFTDEDLEAAFDSGDMWAEKEG